MIPCLIYPRLFSSTNYCLQRRGAVKGLIFPVGKLPASESDLLG